MTTPDLETLGAMTRDYAAFQARKSGLATALGGFMALVLTFAALSPNFMGQKIHGHLLIEFLLWVPVLWLVLKALGGRLLYRELGTVKPLPDAAYERTRWFWILGLATFLMAVLSAGLYAFACGFLQGNQPQAATCPRPMWILLAPIVYILPMPWAIRGLEEARVYAVLVGQGILWTIPFFLFQFRPARPPYASGWGLFGDIAGMAMILLIVLLQVWGALALIRGWKEHQEYLALFQDLPKEDA